MLSYDYFYLVSTIFNLTHEHFHFHIYMYIEIYVYTYIYTCELGYIKHRIQRMPAISYRMSNIFPFPFGLLCFMQVSISSITIPPGQDFKRAKTLPPWDNHCVQKRSPRHRTGSQKPHPRDIKLENFTNISMNSDTI